jgi:hypothetical protein
MRILPQLNVLPRDFSRPEERRPAARESRGPSEAVKLGKVVFDPVAAPSLVHVPDRLAQEI